MTRVVCRECGVAMTARREHLGRSATCPRCEAAITITEAPPLEHPSGLPAPRPAPKTPEPTTTNFDCRVCGTRMSFDLEHVGRKAKCPDCLAVNVIPPPKAPPKAKQPAAFDGPQYEVWQGEHQPWGVDLARNRPQRIRVECCVCQTGMDAAPQDVGKLLTCPDCGAKTEIKPSHASGATKKPTPPTPAPPYEVAQSRPTGPPLAADAWLVDDGTDRPNEFTTGPRPELPRHPMTTGVMKFVHSPGIVGRWLGVSTGLAIAAGLMLVSLRALGFAGAPLGGAAMSAFGIVMIGAAAGLFGAITAFMSLAVAAAFAMTIITETSEGNDRVQEWPPIDPIDCVGALATLAIAAMVSATPGWAVGAAIFTRWSALADYAVFAPYVGALTSAALFFPVVLLSQLAASSAFAIATPEVLITIPRTLGVWLRLLSQSVLLATAGGLMLAATAHTPLLTPVTMLLLVALLAVYCRLIGRLAWVFAERG